MSFYHNMPIVQPLQNIALLLARFIRIAYEDGWLSVVALFTSAKLLLHKAIGKASENSSVFDQLLVLDFYVIKYFK